MADSDEYVPHSAASQLGVAIKGRPHTLIVKSSTIAIYRNASGGKILLTGRGFQYEGEIATGGTVTGAIFEDEKGATYLAWEA